MRQHTAKNLLIALRRKLFKRESFDLTDLTILNTLENTIAGMYSDEKDNPSTIQRLALLPQNKRVEVDTHFLQSLRIALYSTNPFDRIKQAIENRKTDIQKALDAALEPKRSARAAQHTQYEKMEDSIFADVSLFFKHEEKEVARLAKEKETQRLAAEKEKQRIIAEKAAKKQLSQQKAAQQKALEAETKRAAEEKRKQKEALHEQAEMARKQAEIVRAAKEHEMRMLMGFKKAAEKSFSHLQSVYNKKRAEIDNLLEQLPHYYKITNFKHITLSEEIYILTGLLMLYDDMALKIHHNASSLPFLVLLHNTSLKDFIDAYEKNLPPDREFHHNTKKGAYIKTAQLTDFLTELATHASLSLPKAKENITHFFTRIGSLYCLEIPYACKVKKGDCKEIPGIELQFSALSRNALIMANQMMDYLLSGCEIDEAKKQRLLTMRNTIDNIVSAMLQSAFEQDEKIICSLISSTHQLFIHACTTLDLFRPHNETLTRASEYYLTLFTKQIAASSSLNEEESTYITDPAARRKIITKLVQESQLTAQHIITYQQSAEFAKMAALIPTLPQYTKYLKTLTQEFTEHDVSVEAVYCQGILHYCQQIVDARENIPSLSSVVYGLYSTLQDSFFNDFFTPRASAGYSYRLISNPQQQIDAMSFVRWHDTLLEAHSTRLSEFTASGLIPTSLRKLFCFAHGTYTNIIEYGISIDFEYRHALPGWHADQTGEPGLKTTLTTLFLKLMNTLMTEMLSETPSFNEAALCDICKALEIPYTRFVHLLQSHDPEFAESTSITSVSFLALKTSIDTLSTHQAAATASL